jgi:hypothetical protein
LEHGACPEYNIEGANNYRGLFFEIFSRFQNVKFRLPWQFWHLDTFFELATQLEILITAPSKLLMNPTQFTIAICNTKSLKEAVNSYTRIQQEVDNFNASHFKALQLQKWLTK